MVTPFKKFWNAALTERFILVFFAACDAVMIIVVSREESSVV